MNALQFGRMVKQALPAENPLGAAPAAAPAQRPAPAPLPEGRENLNHPQQRGAVHRTVQDSSGSWKTMPPQATVPYPIRGAGRMGAIPSLPQSLVRPKTTATFENVPSPQPPAAK